MMEATGRTGAGNPADVVGGGASGALIGVQAMVTLVSKRASGNDMFMGVK